MEHKIITLQVDVGKKQALEAGFYRLKGLLDQWNQNLVTRKHLRELDDNQLMDIGIDRNTAQRESQKPFWKD